MIASNVRGPKLSICITAPSSKSWKRLRRPKPSHCHTKEALNETNKSPLTPSTPPEEFARLQEQPLELPAMHKCRPPPPLQLPSLPRTKSHKPLGRPSDIHETFLRPKPDLGTPDKPDLLASLNTIREPIGTRHP